MKGNWCSLICDEILDYDLIPLHTEYNIERFKRRIFPGHYNTIQHNQEPPACDIFWQETLKRAYPNKLGNLLYEFVFDNPGQLLKMPPSTCGNNMLFGFLNITCYQS